MQNNISNKSRLLLVISAIALAVSVIVPIWRIELDAPQYPEGLMLQIYANKLGGQVDIINGLNHYIGMQTLHAENFIEFTVLPYIIGFFALLILIAGIVGKRKLLFFSFWLFLAFGIIAMIDFWRWEYNYGHNLDPNAAIIVPGMAYQPPLIGFKQLLNFGAYSVPDIGGWLFISSGVLMLLAIILEYNFFQPKAKHSIAKISIFAFILFIASCNNSSPQTIKLNKDKCDYCSMTIADGRFGAELISKKGRCYKFDDLRCLIDYKKEKSSVEFNAIYVHNYNESNQLIDAKKAFYVQNEDLRSPMGGNCAAFLNKEKAIQFSKTQNANVLSWNDLSE
jgi:copper chaperone NosL